MKNRLFWCAAALGASRFLASLVSSSPLTEFSPQSIDEDYFTPGGLMLLEVVRLSRPSLIEALKTTSLGFVASQLLILFCQAALFQAAATAPRNSRSHERSLSLRMSVGQLAAFSGFSLIRPVASLAAGAALAFGLWPWFWRTYSEHGVALILLGPLALVAVLAFCVETMIATGFDSVRLDLFVPKGAPPARSVLAVLREHALPLFFGRGLLLLWTLGHGGLSLFLMTSRWSASAVWFATAALLGVTVLFQTVWLRYASALLERPAHAGSHGV